MKLLARLEARFGRFAIPNLTLVLIAGQVLIKIIDLHNKSQGGEGVIGRIAFIPPQVLEGEIWRIVTFLFMPPKAHFVLALIFWMVFYLMGSALEHQWGKFRYNVFIFIGAVASMAALFLVPDAAFLDPEKPAGNFLASNFFLYNSVFLAFAFLFPDFVFYLFFILPIRVKWLALIDWLYLGVAVLTSDWSNRVLIIASVANFFLFFGNELWQRLHDKKRRVAFESRMQTAKKKAKYRHKCAICGITNADDPKMQFRYCSKCDGQLGYCMEHLHSHEHVTSEPVESVE